MLAGAVRADGGPTWLRWSAPPECPTASDIGQRADELFGGSLPSDRGLAVATDLRWTGERWEIAVDVELDGHRGQRQVTVDTCSQAADFVAVAVVLAVDPSSSERLANTQPDEPAKPVREAEHRPQPPAEPAAPVRNTPPPSPSEQGPLVAPHLSLSLDAAVGVLPGAHLGGSLWVGADVGRLALSVAGEWYPTTETEVERAASPIDFGLIAGRVNAAYWFFGPRARLGPSLSLHVGSIESTQPGSGRSVHETWVALGLGPQGSIVLAGPVSLLLEAELNLPLVMPTFVLSDGTEVHKPGIGGRFTLGARISLGK